MARGERHVCMLTQTQGQGSVSIERKPYCTKPGVFKLLSMILIILV